MAVIDDADVRRAVDKLASLQSGDLGVVETVACGPKAIPALRRLVFKRDPSGLYETRRRAVEALARLGANGVLIDFLGLSREIGDPVEWTGEEAVINAAARAVADAGHVRAVPVLLDLLNQHLSAGVIEALGKFRCIEALPRFIDALADDFARVAAEGALRQIENQARPALLHTAKLHFPSREHETVSSRRRRRSAVALLGEMGLPPGEETSFTELVQDDDPWVAVSACRIALAPWLGIDPQSVIRRLIALLASADGLLHEEIRECLLDHFEKSKPLIDEYFLAHGVPTVEPAGVERTRQALLRMIAGAPIESDARVSHYRKPL